MHAMRRLLWLALLMTVAGCGAATAPPSDTFARFAELVRAQRDAEAYALLDSATHSRITEAQFVEMLSAEREVIATRADRLAAAPAVTTARVRTQRVEPVTLQLTSDGWRIEGGVGVHASARTPRDAALSFAQAIGDRDLDAILRLLSRARREEINAQMRAILEALREDATVEVILRGNDRATVRLPEGDAIELVLENGEWRVEDLM